MFCTRHFTLIDLFHNIYEKNNLKLIRLLDKCNFVEINRVNDEGHFYNRVYHMVVYRMSNLRIDKLSAVNNN